MGGFLFCCDECPMCDGIERRIKLSEEGYDLQLEYCWCDKVGGSFLLYGQCPDSVQYKKAAVMAGKRKTGSEYRREMKSKSFYRRREICGRSCNPSVGMVKSDYIDGEWVDGSYIKYSSRSSRQRCYKKHSNKRVRKMDVPMRGNGYRKQFDYKWILY